MGENQVLVALMGENQVSVVFMGEYQVLTVFTCTCESHGAFVTLHHMNK